ncbi:MAG: hypothetical protein H6507_07320 [Calditrichaeota bacterium]|nr:hypothetical protein [Calditrichota bacterium]
MNYICLGACCNNDCGIFNDCTHDQWVTAIANNDEVLQWWREMGVTILEVNYDTGDYPFAASSGMRIMNEQYPSQTFKYLEGRVKRVDFGDNNTEFDDPTQWGANVTEVNREVSDNFFRDVLKIGSPDSVSSPETMFAPGWFGDLTGWTRRDITGGPDPFTGTGQDNVMPLHFRVVGDVVENTNDTTNQVATLYCYIDLSALWDQGNCWYDEGGRYLRLPAMNLYKDDFDEPLFNQVDFTVVPQNTEIVVVDANRDPVELPFTCDTTEFDSYPTALEWGRTAKAVEFQIDYTGHHEFLLWQFELWDEGFHRLFRAGADTLRLADSIKVWYQRELDAGSSYGLAGWYYDEFGYPAIESWVKTNSILQEAGLPTMYLNGWGLRKIDPDSSWRVKVNKQMEAYSTTVPTMMTETYGFFGGDSTGMPKNPVSAPIGGLWSRYDSDEPYLDIDSTWVESGSGRYYNR